ncbi:MAG: hypothetical protein LKK00_03470 [Intestinimonas sp.]|nr:hypothetical protein [Intestinimonas sp.]
MKIIVHSPATPQAVDALSRRVATLHAEAVLRQIQHQALPPSEKIRLLRAITKWRYPNAD